jgi:hypothetical protein
MKKIMKIAMISFFAISISCSTARISINAKSAQFPVTLTDCFYDQNYNIVSSDDYIVLYHFKTKYHKVSFYSKGKVKTVDLGPELTALMSKYNGDAIVNVKIKFRNSGLNEYLFDPINLLANFGLFTTAHEVAIIEGDVVKIK